MKAAPNRVPRNETHVKKKKIIKKKKKKKNQALIFHRSA